MSHLEQWIRDNKLQESEVGGSLEPIIQASQLLQARKTETDVDSIVEMCSKLTTSQVGYMWCESFSKYFPSFLAELFFNFFAYIMERSSRLVHTYQHRNSGRFSI